MVKIPKIDDIIMQSVKEHLASIDDMIAEAIDEILRRKLKEFLGVIKQFAVPGEKGDKGDKPLAGKDFPFPKDGKTPIAGRDFPMPRNGIDANVKSITLDVLARMPKIDEQKMMKGIIKQIPKIEQEATKETTKKLNALPEPWLHANSLIGLISMIKTFAVADGGGGGDTIRYVDLSSSLDGSTRDFTLTRVNRILSVHGTSSPIAYRPEVDWTFAETTSILTITSEVDIQSLATGQTLYVLYIEG